MQNLNESFQITASVTTATVSVVGKSNHTAQYLLPPCFRLSISHLLNCGLTRKSFAAILHSHFLLTRWQSHAQEWVEIRGQTRKWKIIAVSCQLV